MRLDEEHVGFFIADSVGHGMPAALLSMYIKRALVTKEITGKGYRLLPPGESLARLNQALVDQELSQATFATALYGYINVKTLEMRFARGGHPAPLLMDYNGHVHHLEAEGPLLGIFGSETFDECAVTLSPKDKLVLYTDGVEVAFTENNVVDQDKWLREFENRKTLNGQELVTDLSQYLDNESGSLEPKDDLTMLVMEVKG
jgi:sigma-B regulation protein RsbU (phosphoserine phosphatase)